MRCKTTAAPNLCNLQLAPTCSEPRLLAHFPLTKLSFCCFVFFFALFSANFHEQFVGQKRDPPAPYLYKSNNIIASHEDRLSDIVMWCIYLVKFTNISIARSYLLESARSHQHSEAKQEWAGLVLAWGISMELPVTCGFFLQQKKQSIHGSNPSNSTTAFLKKKQRETKKSGMDVVESTESTRRGWKKYVTKKDDHHECCGRVCVTSCQSN